MQRAAAEDDAGAIDSDIRGARALGEYRLAIFGMAMAISFGPQSPLHYSVISASAAALLLWVSPAR